MFEDLSSEGKGEDDAGATLTSKGDGPLQLLGQCADQVESEAARVMNICVLGQAQPRVTDGQGDLARRLRLKPDHDRPPWLHWKGVLDAVRKHLMEEEAAWNGGVDTHLHDV